MKSFLQLLINPVVLVIFASAVISTIWLIGRILRSRTKTDEAPAVYKGIVLLIAFCMWAFSAYAIYALAHFSINQTVIDLVFYSNFIFLVVAFVLILKNKTVAGLSVAVAPLPAVVMCVVILNAVMEYVVPLFETESPEFTEACKNTGAQFFRTPTLPVSSISYHWTGKSTRGFAIYELGRYGRLAGMSGGGLDKHYPRLKEALKFNEHKPPANDDFQPLADIIVTYRIFPEEELAKAPIHQGPVTHELTVTDQRDGQTLATMRYVIDQKDRRICGPISNNVLSEYDFLAKALALE
ncbi:MAG: hypothetical protein IT488_11495 [Gammaproteobacteria bacterium]|nr:hypothetical protein [Gammaproteobacteria bacterium]